MASLEEQLRFSQKENQVIISCTQTLIVFFCLKFMFQELLRKVESVSSLVARQSNSLSQLDTEKTSLTSQLSDVTKQLQESKCELEEKLQTLSIEREAQNATLEAWTTEVGGHTGLLYRQQWKPESDALVYFVFLAGESLARETGET